MEKLVQILVMAALDWALKKGIVLNREILEHKALKDAYKEMDERKEEASKYLNEELAKLKKRTDLTEEDANAISDSINDEYFKRLG